MKLGVIIPVYNEARLAPKLIERVLATRPPAVALATDERRAQEGHLPVTRRLYIVDDGSTDGTWDYLRSLQTRADLKEHVRIFSHEHNRGKGAAVRTGLARALEDGSDAVLIQDADLEYDPRDHAALLAPILDGRADAVIGSRFGGEAHRVLYFWHYLANRLITTLSNVFTNLNLSDIECCLKAMTREVAEQITLTEDRFGIEPELIAKIARAKVVRHDDLNRPAAARVYEVAVSYAGRTYAEGKKISWRDGLSAVRCILKYNLGS